MCDTNIDIGDKKGKCVLTSLNKSLHQQVKDVGIECIFNQVSSESGKKMSSKTFSNKVNPSQEKHHLTLQEFILILKHLEKEEKHHQVIEEMLNLFKLKAEKTNPSQMHDLTYKSLLNRLLLMEELNGGVHSKIRLALLHGKVSENALYEIKREISHYVSAINSIKEILESSYNHKATFE